MKKLTTSLCLLIIFFFGCKRKINELEFERSVLMQIIPSIVDSTCQDPRIFLSPPPYPLLPHDGKTSVKEEQLLTKKWELKRDSIRKDTSSVYLAFNPVITASTDSLKKELELFTNSKITQLGFKGKLVLDIDSIKLNQHFKFKHHNLFSNQLEVWNKKYEFIFSGFFYISRIVFDDSRSFGALSVGYTCGGLCGQGYIIFIKKQGKNWRIDKIVDTWIS